MGKKDVISKNTNSQVYKYYSKKYRRTVCKKVLKTSAQDKMERFKKEPQFLEKLKNNENVIQLISFKFVDCFPDLFECKIITEYYEKGNLRNYIVALRRDGMEFGDRVLEYIYKFVSFFAYLQTEKISHRDIKPENIFINAEGQLKIGDFGCSTTTFGQDEFTIQGTPYFLSPELRIGYNKYIQRMGGYKIKHCPYKSDVFSLGLVFLTMANMENLDDSFSGIDELENSINKRIEKVKHEVVKDIIRIMLTIDSKNRPDFLQLNQIIDNNYRSICNLCKGKVSDQQLFCSKCEVFAHFECADGGKCRCGDFYRAVCSRCSDKFYKYRNCLHVFCDACAAGNYECEECCNILKFGEQSQDSPRFPTDYLCIFDNVKCNFENNTSYNCPICMKYFCAICKQMHNESASCKNTKELLNIICKCARKITMEDLDSIFYLCEGPCGFRCLVCLRSINLDHTNCCRLLLG